MSVGVYSWSTTASSNGGADDNINFAEGMQPAALNNSARAMMAAIKAWGDALGGGVTYGGSSSDYTITNNAVGAWSAYASGQIIALKANHTNDDTQVNVNVDGLGNVRVKTNDGGDPAIGDFVSGGIYLLAYDGTNFQVLNTIAGGSYQPLDATLTALAALSYTSGELLVSLSAADTFSLRTVTSAGLALLDDADASAQRTTLGLGTSAIVNTGTSGATIPLLNAAAEFSAGLTSRFDGGQANFALRRAVNTNGNATQMAFSLNDSAGNATDYVRVLGLIVDNTDTSEDGRYVVQTMVNGVLTTLFDLNGGTSTATFTHPILAPAGSAAAPAIAGSGDTNTGVYFDGSDNFYIATAGVVRWAFLAGGGLAAQGAFPLRAGDGVVGTPSLSFTNDNDNGWYRIGVNNWAGSVGGSKFIDISSTAIAFDVPVTARVLDSSETSGSLTSASRNRRVVCSGGVTLPASGMTAGDFILIDPAGTARTITRPAAHTMYVRDTDVASDDSYAHQIVVAIFHGSSKWTLHGLP